MKKIGFILLTMGGVFSKTISLDTINIDINTSKNMGIITNSAMLDSTTYTRKYLDNATGANGTFSEIIKRNPNARILRGERNSKNGGEIAPENISINGASFYQNNFIFDGVSINNDINPLGKAITTANVTNFNLIFLPNPSQGLNIVTDLIESIEVKDSAVSAKYGNFQGGVIKATSRDPRHEFRGKISFRHTSDKMRKAYYNDEQDQKECRYSTNTSQCQPNFKKYKVSAIIEGYVSENFGLIFNYTQMRSLMEQKKYTKDYPDKSKISQTRKTLRKNQNFFLKGIWHVNDDLIIKPSITYAPSLATYHGQNYEKGEVEIKGGGINGAVEAKHNLNFGHLNQRIAYQTNQIYKTTDSDMLLVWFKTPHHPGYSSKSSTYIEGASGDMQQIQKKFLYNADFDLNEFHLGSSIHRLISGFSFENVNAKVDITKPYYLASIGLQDLGANHCDKNDKFCKNEPFYNKLKRKSWKGQWFKTRQYISGKTRAKMNYFAFYLEDKINIERFMIRPGIRIDKNDYMGKVNFAPRFSTNMDVFDDDSLNIFAGYNRYYGRSIFAYKLKEKFYSLKSHEKRKDLHSPWIKFQTDKDRFSFSHLRVPYDDEYSLGASQKFFGFEISAKYLKRKGKDLIRVSDAKSMNISSKDTRKFYTNEGKSNSNIYTIKFRNLDDFEIFGSQHGFEISCNYTQTDRNFEDYDDKFDDLDENLKKKDKVYLDGNLIHKSNLPKNKANLPWVFNATINSKIWHLNWANFFSFQNGYEGLVMDGKIDGYENWQRKKFKKTFNWDSKFIFTFPTINKQSGYISLEIYNILDTKNTVSLDQQGKNTTYGSGREFWLEAGYKW